MSWSSHHLGQDGSEDALHRGGSNVWINALPAGGVAAPTPAPPSGGDSCVGDVCGSVAQVPLGEDSTLLYALPYTTPIQTSI